MSQIKVSDLTFAYEGSYDDIFTEVSFQLDTSWKLGFCGRNGRGKTTFLKLLMGEYEYKGTITASVDFEYFPFPVSDTSSQVIDIITQIAGDAEFWEIQKELSKLAISEDVLYRPFSTLSNGEQTKTLLAALFLKKNAFLLIDEPTDHLDSEARKIVATYLKNKAGFILVSHDRLFLDDCIDHILSINKTKIELQSGNFSSWFTNKQRQDEFELAENEKLKKDIKRLESAARQSSQWADRVEAAKQGKGAAKLRKRGHINIDTRAYYGEKSRRIQQRRKNLERRQGTAIEEKSNLLKDIETVSSLKLEPLEYHSSRLLSFDKVTVTYNQRKIFENLSFALEQGERLALVGGNGCGKSSVLKLLMGEDIPHTGKVHVAANLITSYVPQNPDFLYGDLNDYAEDQEIDVTLFKTILRKLDFSREQFDKQLQDFSAGQKKKVLIAASLCQSAHVYIWDEPLNYLDVFSRMQIEELILAYRPTLLFVEHDRAFGENIATRTLSLVK